MIPVKVSGMLMFLVLLQIMEYMVQSYHLELVFLVKPLPEHSLIDNQIIGDYKTEYTDTDILFHLM